MPITIDGFSPTALRAQSTKRKAVATHPKSTIKAKQDIKIGPVPRTQGPTKAQIANQAAIDLKVAQALKDKTKPPEVLSGFGPGGLGVSIARAGVALAKVALRSPGTRGVAEKIAGRATTLKPFLGRGPTLGQAAGFVGGVIAAETIIGAGEGIVDLAQRQLAGPVRTAGGKALQPMHPGTGKSMAQLPGVGGHLPAGTTIVKTWNTGTAQFARLADGRIAVQKKDGTIKVYRPQKHIVIPRNPRIGTLIRADKRLDRLVKGLRKVVKSGKR